MRTLLKSYFTILLLVMSLGLLSASTYTLELNHIANQLVVNEYLDNSKISVSATQDGLNKLGNEYYFVKEIVFPKDFSSAEIILKLDLGVMIKDEQIYPKNYELETDGSRIIVRWKFNNVKAGDSVALFVIMQDNGFYLSPLEIISLIAIIILICILLFYSIKRRRNSGFDSHLMESEKKVIEELKKANKNELWQKQLQIKTGFSKAKLSRVIRDLESRDLITKVPLGNTNKIILK